MRVNSIVERAVAAVDVTWNSDRQRGLSAVTTSQALFVKWQVKAAPV